MSLPFDDTTSPATAPLVRERKAVARSRMAVPMLVCVEGLQVGMQFPLTPGENIIGRGGNVDISLQDDMASRRHARVYFQRQKPGESKPTVLVEDLGSRNGTDLNGEPLTRVVQLQEHDRIQVGTTLLGFYLRDEKELETEQLLYEMATRDALTGLDNRHQFKTHLRHHVERARRQGVPLSLIIIDADHFKSVNDRHGHDVGDKVLIHLARSIESCCRASEICARWGGEEFVVLVPDADKAAAYALAERIRLVVEASPLRNPEGAIYLSVSGGCAELTLTDDAESLFRNADQNLLKAKQLGRNRVCCV